MLPRKNQKSKNMKKQSKSQKQSIRSLPPSRDLRLAGIHTFRFKNTTGVTDRAVDRTDLLGLLGTATSASAVASLFESVKIHRIDLWTIGANSTSTTQSVAVKWSGLASGQDWPELVSTTTLGVAQPSHLTSSPPPGSLASFCISKATAGTIFTITAPANTIIDLRCSFVMQNAQSSAIVSYVSSGLTAGFCVFGPLDHASGTPVFIPELVTYYG